MIANGYRVPRQGDENALKLTVVMAAQHCEYTETNEFHPLMCELFGV